MKFEKVNLQLFGAAEDEAMDILHELNQEYDHLSAELQVEVAKLAQLVRIADSLEGVNKSLETLAGCTERHSLMVYVEQE